LYPLFSYTLLSLLVSPLLFSYLSLLAASASKTSTQIASRRSTTLEASTKRSTATAPVETALHSSNHLESGSSSHGFLNEAHACVSPVKISDLTPGRSISSYRITKNPAATHR